MKMETYPPRYTPYRTVRLRSNVFESVSAIFSVNGYTPLLVGRGTPPRIWLSLPTTQDAMQWRPVIKENFSSHPDFAVQVNPKRVLVQLKGQPIIHVIEAASDELNFLMLDLRPIGLKIYVASDSSSLIVMGTTLRANTFKNVGVAINLETDGQSPE